MHTPHPHRTPTSDAQRNRLSAVRRILSTNGQRCAPLARLRLASPRLLLLALVLVVAVSFISASLVGGRASAITMATPGQALDFDGADDYVNIGIVIPIQLGGDKVTGEAWVYLKSHTEWGTFVKNWGESTTFQG